MKYFGEWTRSALKEIAMEMVRDSALADRLAATHKLVVDMAKRHGMAQCVVGKHYLSLCRHFVALMERKKSEKDANRKQLQLGLSKIEGASGEVEAMSTKLEGMKQIVEQKHVFCEKLLVQLIQQKRDLDAKKMKCELEAKKTEREEVECSRLREEAQHDLDDVLPGL